MTGKFAANPYYVEYEDQLKELSRLMAEGQGDTDEAETLRDAMDQSVRKLTREEVERLNGLSADLYMLQDREIFEPLEPGEDPAEREPERLRARLAEVQGDAQATLVLLRKGTAGLAEDERAYLRARAYEELGHLDTALLFMRNAQERAPTISGYQWKVLDLLGRLDQRDELYVKASEHLQDESSAPELRILAAGYLIGLTRRMAAAQAAPLFELIIHGLQSALPLFDGAPQPFAFDLPAYAQLTLGFCYQRLGRREAALDAFDKAMVSGRFRGAALVFRGLLLLAESDRDEALADFESAIKSNTPLVVPYLHLAYQALIRNDYGRCLELCEQAWTRTVNPRLRAVLLQWTGIAGVELGKPVGEMTGLLEMALALDPLNPHIRDNLEVFRQRAQNNSDVPSLRKQWQLPATPDIEAGDLLHSLPGVAA